MGDASRNVYLHIFDRLDGSAELAALIPGGIHEETAPRGTVCPHLVIVANAPGTDRNNMSRRVFTGSTWLVKAVTEGGSFNTAVTIMILAEQLLGRTHRQGVLGIYRDGIVKYTETDGDVRYNHYGYLYRGIGTD